MVALECGIECAEDADPEQAFLVKNDLPYWYYLIPAFGALLLGAGALNIVQGVRGVGPGATAE